MNFRPLRDQVLVKRRETRDATEGGIVIPKTAQKAPTWGTVIAVGRGKPLDNGRTLTPQVKPGDEVVFGEYSGAEVELEGESYFIARDEEILGFVEEE